MSKTDKNITLWQYIKGKYKKSRGHYLGSIPFGFDSGSGSVIIIDSDPTDQYHQVITQIDTRV